MSDCLPSAPCGACDFCSDVDGGALLDELRAALARYVVFPSAEALDAVVLFVAATHAQTAWEHATRLVIKSPLKRCGKTRLQEVAAEVAHRVLKTTNISPAALVRTIGYDDPPTIILDEADAIFATRRGERSEGAEDLRGLLNSGHSRGWPYIRWDAAARRLEECPTFSMAIIGGIGDMPDTIEDRAVIVSMRRRAAGETVAQYRRRRSIGPLHDLRDRLHSWVRSHLDELADAEPDLPVEDRAADTWEPLVAIADLAGGTWPARAREVCEAMTGGAAADQDESAGERLLADLRDVFGDADHMPTAAILERLAELEEAPWSTWHRGQPLSAKGLGGLLRPYGVRSVNIMSSGSQSKGYHRQGALADAWRRYLGADPSDPSTRPHPPETAAQAADETPDGSENGTRPRFRPASEQGEHPVSDGWTGDTAARLNGATTCRVCGLASAEPVHPLCAVDGPSATRRVAEARESA